MPTTDPTAAPVPSPPAAAATELPAIGSRCWRDQISSTTGATVLHPDTTNAEASGSSEEVMVELAYDEGGSGWWPLATLLFALE